jgi:hypothetical protein
VLSVFVTSADVIAVNCAQTSVNRVPLSDLDTNLYLNQYQGGLYPGGLNIMPGAHAQEGFARALAVGPLNVQGQPSRTGRYVLLSIGMSNTTQEYTRFMQLAAANSQVNHTTLAIVDGAAGGQTASTWDSPTDANYDRVRDQELAPLGLSELQVQAAWVKVANAQPGVALPSANADAFTLLAQMGHIVRAMKVRYPNLKVVFLSSRIYAGYASTPLNPEPYAYESGFAVKWLIEAQIAQMSGGVVHATAGDLNYNTIAPWIAWGPYLWADGLTPRSDGLIWLCSDLQNDGTHPSPAGREKVANMLLRHLLDGPASRPWFRTVQDADITNDGAVNADDVTALILSWGGCPAAPALCDADIAPGGGDGDVNVDDLIRVILEWG